MVLSRSRAALLVCLVVLAWSSPLGAQGLSNPFPLLCAVESERDIVKPGQLCEALGRALGRQVQRVSDARVAKHGEAVQIFGGDVQWVVALLREGRVHAWTRISKTHAQGKELETIARATRTLFKQRLRKREACVRVDPRGGRATSSFDLAYPWAELSHCTQRVSDVIDPWWRD